MTRLGPSRGCSHRVRCTHNSGTAVSRTGTRRLAVIDAEYLCGSPSICMQNFCISREAFLELCARLEGSAVAPNAVRRELLGVAPSATALRLATCMRSADLPKQRCAESSLQSRRLPTTIRDRAGWPHQGVVADLASIGDAYSETVA